MRSTLRRLPRYGTLTALTLCAGVLGLSTAAAAVVDPAPIGPHQYFVGEVNGVSAGAVVKVACPGPAGTTGHPLAGQTVDVLPTTSPTSSVAGYTGESADRVLVDFGSPSTGTPLVLTMWAVKAAIPTSLNVPCSGTGTVAFVPVPTSSTARSALVRVSYVNVAG